MKMLNWVNRFSIFCFLDNHNYQSAHQTHECLMGAGAFRFLEAEAGQALEQLRSFSDLREDWLFGHFGYDLKNELEPLHSGHPDRVGFPDLFFFAPLIVCQLQAGNLVIGSLSGDPREIFNQINAMPLPGPPSCGQPVQLEESMSRAEYLLTVQKLQEHIRRGDCYEINFCQEFHASGAVLDPLQTYLQLSRASPTPFAAFYRLGERYLCCASPERYLRRQGDLLISQPMKGTWPRDNSDGSRDEANKASLLHSPKDRSENVMVVDLVRNDLSRICQEGSVAVEELYGIYSFPQVHQMISTVRGRPLPGIHWVDIIGATFPMGSMTGMPKKRVLELIEKYEKSRRGIFSGSIGYVKPGGDFDFNVIIRSIMYNRAEASLSYQVGSAITFYSEADMEYEECMVKAKAIKKVLA